MGTVNARIQIWSDTAANFTSDNPTLAEGQFAKESDTGKLKLGDGTTAWTSLDYYSVFYEEGTWIPVITGYTTSPTALAWYKIIGNVCEAHIEITGTAPTSNATTKTATLPFAANAVQYGSVMQAIDNTSTNTVGVCKTAAASNVLDVYPTPSTGVGWTASGSGRFRLVISYIIE